MQGDLDYFVHLLTPIESVSWDGDVYQVSESKIVHRLEGDDTTLH